MIGNAGSASLSVLPSLSQDHGGAVTSTTLSDFSSVHGKRLAFPAMRPMLSNSAKLGAYSLRHLLALRCRTLDGEVFRPCA